MYYDIIMDTNKIQKAGLHAMRARVLRLNFVLVLSWKEKKANFSFFSFHNKTKAL